MNKQKIFDTAYNAIIKQNSASLKQLSSGEKFAVCLYSGIDETKCAIGHLISDVYSPSFESLRIRALVYTYSDVRRVLDVVDANDVEFLSQIQEAHDSSIDEEDFMLSFKNRMKNVAENYKLTIPGE